MKGKIRLEIEDFVAAWRERQGTATRWETPLVGFAAALDPLFAELKNVASPTHALPGDLLPGARTVVAFFLPFEKSIPLSNIAGIPVSWEWARGYIETNALIGAVTNHMKLYLESRGHAVAVTPATHNFDPEKLVSDWSHRHVAFVAGLGRFGQNNMLITARGCCGRLGSFVTDVFLPPDSRTEVEACLHRHDGSCLRCVERCVNAALFADRFDRKQCHAMCLRNGTAFREMGKADVCGKCMVGVPCSFTNPVRARLREEKP